MEHGGLGYVDAIEELAQSVGLTVPHEAGTGRRQAPSEAPGLMSLLDSAARYYQRRLREATPAIDYLKGRGLSGVTAARFGLGYAPPGWRNLEAAVADYNDAGMVRAGLVKDSLDDGSRPVDGAAPEPAAEESRAQRKRYDRFRDRVMFPIRNPRGGIIGFGGRVLGDGEPKYLNSPETPVFSKGRELYGLYEGRTELRNQNQAIVVEGYMDVVMLAEHGINNAVATLGTATTADHIRKLFRIVDTLVFCFDGDRAGKKAAWRALETCLPIITDTQRVQFLFLPDGEDPDSYVSQSGADGFREAVAGAQPLSAFMIDRLSADDDLDSPEGRARLLAEARPMLAAFKADGMRMQMTREIADLAGIGLVQLQQYLDKHKTSDRPPPNAPPGGRDTGQSHAAAPRRDGRRHSLIWIPSAP
jgi:DNA primase